MHEKRRDQARQFQQGGIRRFFVESDRMPFVIAPACVADYSCVEICPVDCISPGPHEAAFAQAEQLYIDPIRCIECGACVDVCPVSAIYSAESLPQKWAHFADVNRSYFEDREARHGPS
jgi:formate hydrogenlyase subunit 6/NADH:ubiquinone oxidoreductase subunit I